MSRNSRSSKRRTAQAEGYRSHFEFEIAKQAEKDSIRVKYEPEESRVAWVPKVKTYTPDFVLDNGIIVEAKGRLTVHDRSKHLLVKEQHPELDIRFVFQYNNPITKGSKTRYTDWAEKHSFKWAMSTIPKEWAKEKKR
jgi:hypothetical protein